MQMKVKAGLGLMALGVGVWAAWDAWTRTRTMVPLQVPVRVMAGHSVDHSFTVNYDGLYLIEIAAIGAHQGQLAQIDAEWTLWNCGQEVKRGSTAEAHSAPGESGGAARVIGDFHGRAGENYQLQVRFTEDAPRMLAGNARLRVEVSGLARENLQAANVLVFSTMFICELFGVILVGVGIWERRGRSPCDAHHKSE